MYTDPAGGLKNGNQEQRSRSKGLEGAKGRQRHLRNFQTQAEGEKDSTVAIEEPAAGPLTRPTPRSLADWPQVCTRLTLVVPTCGAKVTQCGRGVVQPSFRSRYLGEDTGRRGDYP